MLRHKGFEEFGVVKEFTPENTPSEKGYTILAKNSEGNYNIICECRFVGDEDETEDEE